MIDWVIFDLGAVLIDWNPRYAYRRVAAGAFERDLWSSNDEKIEHFLKTVATSEWNSQLDAGLSFERAIAARRVDVPDWSEWLEMWRHDWPTMMRGPIDGTVEIFEDVVRARHAGHIKGVLALSNWEAGTFKIARARFPFLEKFDARLISGEEALVKPDPNFFKLLESRHGVVPERAIFVDDLVKNTEVAKSLGYHVHVFKDPEALRFDLIERNVIQRA